MQRLQDLEDIKTLKHRYFRAMTHGDHETLKDTLTADVVTSYSDGHYVFNDREKLLKFLIDSHDPNAKIIAWWMAGMPEISFQSDTEATGIWAMYHYFFNQGKGFVDEMFVYYDDAYRKEDGVWRFWKTGYKRVINQILDRSGCRTRSRRRSGRWRRSEARQSSLFDATRSRSRSDAVSAPLRQGRISGALGVFLGALSVLAVLCFHFPEYLTTPELRRAYPVDVLRWVLLAGMILAVFFGALSLLLSPLEAPRLRGDRPRTRRPVARRGPRRGRRVRRAGRLVRVRLARARAARELARLRLHRAGLAAAARADDAAEGVAPRSRLLRGQPRRGRHRAADDDLLLGVALRLGGERLAAGASSAPSPSCSS